MTLKDGRGVGSGEVVRAGVVMSGDMLSFITIQRAELRTVGFTTSRRKSNTLLSSDSSSDCAPSPLRPACAYRAPPG